MTDPRKKSTASRALELAIEVPAVIVTLAMMLHITTNAVMRTFFNDPLKNTLEITQYWYLPILAFLGFIAAQLKGQHVAADLIYERLPSVTKRYVLTGVFLIAAVVAFGFARFGWEEALHARDIGKTAGVSDLTAWQPYFLVPVAFGALTIQFVYAAISALVKGTGVTEHPASDPGDAMVGQDLAVEERGGR